MEILVSGQRPTIDCSFKSYLNPLVSLALKKESSLERIVGSPRSTPHQPACGLKKFTPSCALFDISVDHFDLGLTNNRKVAEQIVGLHQKAFRKKIGNAWNAIQAGTKMNASTRDVRK